MQFSLWWRLTICWENKRRINHWRSVCKHSGTLAVTWQPLQQQTLGPNTSLWHEYSDTKRMVTPRTYQTTFFHIFCLLHFLKKKKGTLMRSSWSLLLQPPPGTQLQLSKQIIDFQTLLLTLCHWRPSKRRTTHVPTISINKLDDARSCQGCEYAWQ